jgi:uncharacterized protein
MSIVIDNLRNDAMRTASTIPIYQSPWWLQGAHAQTIYPPLFARRPSLNYQRERWDTTPNGKPDGDFIDIDRIVSTESSASKPMLVVFHGLEGSSQSIYARNLMAAAQSRGWRGMVPHFRGCSGEINRLPRAYHSGDATEIDWILRRVKAEAPDQPLYVVAISLGGNASLKWLGEQGSAGASVVDALVAVSAPLDLMASGEALGQGFNKFYSRMFLNTMKKSALKKLELHPGIFNRDVVVAAQSLRAFDNEVTAPLHGYRDTDDYWTRASAKPGLANVQVPALILNAQNDPFLPASALPKKTDVSRHVTLDFPLHGGHVGFLSAPFPGYTSWMPQRAFHFFEHGA